MIIEIEHLLRRHGEVAVQALVENLERYEGIKADITASLEQRWSWLMHNARHTAMA